MLFALALLGGIPRATDWNGMLFWMAWMATQAAQLLITVISILFELAAFLSVRRLIWPCLVTVDGMPLLDFYAWTTFAAHPAIIIKLAIVFAYAFLLNLGLLVFDGSCEWPWHSWRSVPIPPLHWEEVKRPPKRGKELKSTALEDELLKKTALEDKQSKKADFDWSEWRSILQKDEANNDKEKHESLEDVFSDDKEKHEVLKDVRSDDKEKHEGLKDVRYDSFIKITDGRYFQPKRLQSSPQESHSAEPDRESEDANKKDDKKLARCLPVRILKSNFILSARGAHKPKDKQFRSALPLSLPFFHAARCVLFAVAFSAWPMLGSPAGIVPGVVFAWVSAVILAATMPMLAPSMEKQMAKLLENITGKDPDAPENMWMTVYSRTFMVVALLAPPLLASGGLLLLAPLFVSLVAATYLLGSFAVSHVTQNANGENVWTGSLAQESQESQIPSATQEGVAKKQIVSRGVALTRSLCRWATRRFWRWANLLAGPAKTSLSWLGTLATFAPANAVLSYESSEYVAFDSTSFATLAGGLACFWGVLAVSPSVSYHAWARVRMLHQPMEHNATELGSGALPGWSNSTVASLGDGLDALVGWKWAWDSLMMWLFLSAFLTVLLLGCVLFHQALHKDNDRLRYQGLRFICLYSPPLLFIFLFLIAQSTHGKQLIAIAYASVFEAFATLKIEWDGLLPSLDSVLELLSDPAATLANLLERVSNLTVELDPEYFNEGIKMLNALNLCLGLLKLVATYGRKFFALLDAVNVLLGRATITEHNDDGTVQVAESVTDNEAVQASELLIQAGWEQAFAALEQETSLNWSGRAIQDRHLAGIAWLFRQAETEKITDLE